MTQRHGIYSVPLPISGKKVAANVVTLAAWRSGRDSNPREVSLKLISSNFETVPLRRHIEAVHGSYYALNPLKNKDFLSI